MGSLRKRGGVWWVRYYRDGRRHAESSGSAKETEARRLLRLREGDIERGLPVSAKIGRLRFEEAAQDLVNDYRTNRKATLKDVERRVDLHLRPFFGGRRLSTITTSDIRAYIVERQEAFIFRHHKTGRYRDERRRVSNGEINRELTALKRIFRLAHQAGKLMMVPHVPMLQEHNVRTGFFEREQFEAVRSHMPDAVRGVLTFAYYTGWRVDSEVLPLQWRQIDFQAGTVRLDSGTTKNDEGRVFMFHELGELRKTLEAQRASADGLRASGTLVPWVFHRAGTPIRSFRKAWKDACLAAGCPGRLIHDLRRTAVRNLVRAGVPERVAMQLTGHKTRSVFERYNIVSSTDLLEASRMLNAAGSSR
jgi:integrase